MLHLAEDLSFPLDLATQTVLVVGKRGSGKSSTCVRLAEQFFKAKIPFVVIDPTDKWYGLKAGKDGKGPGLGVYIFGGHHEDLPLESVAGQLVADIIVDHRISCVLSMKHFSGRERGKFVSDFADRLFRRNIDPLHVFLEEAHEVCPQNPFKGEEEMLGRVTRLWKLGRSSGIGGSAITQRPASLSKNITTQAEILIVHRMLGPQDVAAVREWIKYHGESEEVLSRLSELKTGEAWLWAPDFPENRPVGLRRVKILPRETFDSSATPKVGEHRTEPKNLAPVDLDVLRTKMSSIIERAKQEDPRELRKKILELEKELRKKPTHVPFVPPIPPVIKEIPVLKDAQIAALEKAVKKLEEISGRFAGPIDQMAKSGLAITDAIGKFQNPLPVKHSVQFAEKRNLPVRPTIPKDNIPISNLSNPEQRILNSIAWMESIGIIEPKQTAIAFLAGYSYGGGAFNNPRGSLRTKGLIEYRGDSIALTDHGRPLATPLPYPLTVEEMHGRVLKILPGPERKLMEVVLSVYPNSITNEELADRAGYVVGGGAFNNPRGRLRTLGLIEYNNGLIKAKSFLFFE